MEVELSRFRLVNVPTIRGSVVTIKECGRVLRKLRFYPKSANRATKTGLRYEGNRGEGIKFRAISYAVQLVDRSDNSVGAL